MFRRRCLFRTLILLLSIGSISSSDESASLLAFKRSVVSDPSGTLTSWSDNPLSDPCSWSGITCDSRSRVSKIEIPQNPPKSCPNFDLFCSRKGLVGRIAPEIGNLTALRVISLPWNGFEGGLPEEVVRLGSLEVVDLTGNKLSGEIPRRFGRRIRVLRLGFNEFEGGIPAEGLVDCVGLESLDLSRNKLNGSVPGVLFRRFSKLKEVLLGFNRLSGSIPPEGVGIIGSGYCVSLERISLEGNLLTGSIPLSFGSCRELRSLVLSSNLLEDVVPKELGRLSKLRVLDVSRNSLSGPLPSELGNCLELSVLVLSNAYDPVVVSDGENNNGHIDEFNFFQGGIPENITSLPQLRILWAPRAMLEGEIPSDWGNCKSLEMVNLGENLFTREIPKAFGRCGNLKHLNLSSNKLTGWLPDELSVPCMDVFDVSGNQLSGLIPRFSYNECSTATSRLQKDDLSSAYYSFFKRSAQTKILLNLLIGPPADGFVMSIHDFGRNNFSGSFPSLPISPERLGNGTLYALFVDGNSITGTFPGSFFEKCENVNGLILNISGNMIFGVLPTDIDVLCRSLMVLDASGNRISGTIPQQVGQMRSLVGIDLSGNRLYGQIPWSFGLLKGLKRLALAANNLTGDIPSGLSELSSLQVLDLSSNSLSGEIPTALLKQGNLSILFLNNNKLSGRIPASLANNTSLSLFNVSFNNLSGPIPVNGVAVRCDSAIGNPMLEACHMASLSVPPSDAQSRGEESLPYTASPPGSSPGNGDGAEFTSIEIASISSATAIVSVLLALIVLYVYTRKCAPRSAIQNTGRKELTVFTDIGVPLTYESVVRATGGFNASNCIGSGGFGATYKAEIAPGVVVAVKRLSVGRIAGVQQFHAEVKTLGRWRHQNLVTLIGFHVSEAEMFLIYNYLPGGNLETFIQERSQRSVDWRMLHKIALDVARALAYLHENCVPRILHRDVKPSNILLDNDYNAYLSDFGLARLLGNSETHATTGVAGTFGYVAPEYAMTCRVSDKADVYSYGVVLLELISNKKALDPSFSPYGNGFNIVAWAHRLLSKGRAHEFFTEGLWDVGPHDDLVDTLHLAITCTDDSLSTRPTMKHVVQRLKQIQPPICSPLMHYTS